MQLEAHQIYVLFSMLAGAIVLIGLSYCTGLRTGRDAGFKQGSDSANLYAKSLLKITQGEQAELRGMLAREEQLTDSIRTQAHKLRTALYQEQADHNTIVRDLLSMLERERANSLTLDDYQVLMQAARVLGYAAAQVRKSGSTKTNHAAKAQSQLNDIAARVHAALTAPQLMAQMADSTITDTDMIEWLDREASYHGEPETGELRFPVVTPKGALPSLRDILQLAIQQQGAREHGLGTWERVDADMQPAVPMCA